MWTSIWSPVIGSDISFRHCYFIAINLKVEREKLRRDQLRYHGGLKALTGSTMLKGMNALEPNYSNVKTPYLLILGSDDKLCYIDGSKVDLLSNNLMITLFLLFKGVLQVVG